MKATLTTLLLALAITAGAQIRGNEYTVAVTPSRLDWTYKAGETVTFDVSVRKSGVLLPGATVTCSWGPEMYETEHKAVTLRDGHGTVKATMRQPGFLRLTARANISGHDYEGYGTAAMSPEQIQPYAQAPKDFDQFWAASIAEARNTALEPHMELLPERSNGEVTMYHVSFQNDRWGRRVYGILSVPKKAGRYPALLRVPGAGVRPYSGDDWTTRQGVIVLEIGIHGIPVTREQEYYDNLFSAALADYWHNGLHSPYRNYYRHVVTGCIRAIDFLESLPLPQQWNATALGVTGSSQGGFLTLATTALDKRVTCYGAVHAALCDHEASLHGRACGWPHYFYKEKDTDPALVNAARYYDGVNFARRIRVPGFFSFGYNDNVVPPTTAWATYNSVAAPKTLSPYRQTAHFWYQEQWDEWQQWLLERLRH